MKSKKLYILLACLIFCVFFSNSYAAGDAALYKRGEKSLRNGDINVAFSDFRLLLVSFPDSRFYKGALFAVGEYYFFTANYFDAENAFSEFVDKFDEAEEKLFALAYLLEIHRKRKNENIVTELEKEIITYTQVSLLFREFKECEFASPLLRKHKAIYFIDKVEFYVDGELLTTVFY
ncbi:MAG: outer membrane protein assembly factor BamD [Candidatus Omnitrophica bacterium]|nr:outer membrane protein assembly factor BamD [Candidatus Omnitrophota bacterium]